MQVQVNTDSHIVGNQGLQEKVENAVESALGRFSNQITRVEVHLNDVNGPKSGEFDIRCMMEVRLAGMQPMAATDQGGTLDQALDGASEKLQRKLDSTLGKLSDQQRARDRE